MLAAGEGTTPRRGLIDGPDAMLADEGTFKPLLAHAATTAGGESVASAAARQRVQQRAETAATGAELGREVDVRGETARGLVDEMTLRRDAAYTAAERTADRIPINTESQIHGDLMKSEDFGTVLTVARKERGTEPGAALGDDYPKTKKELLGGYRNIDKNEQALYEKRGWEVKVTRTEGARDSITGEPGPDKVLYRAFDPDGPGLNLRQIDEITKAFNTVAEGYKGKGQQSAVLKLAKSFRRNFVEKSPRLIKAGQMHDEVLRLEDAATAKPSDLLSLKPEELRLKLKFDGRAQEGFPDGKPRSAQQQKILRETLWDDISRQVREAKGRPSQALMDSVEVLMNDKARFANWKDAVMNAEKYGLSWERFGRAYDPKEDLPPSAAEAVGKIGRRMAEFFFSAPFAAARQLDRTLSKAQLIRNQAVNDAVVDMLTKTGKPRAKAELLIKKAIAEKTVSPADERRIMEIFRMAIGLGPQMEDAAEMPYVGATGRGVGYGLIGAGGFARGLIPGVN